MVTVWPLLSASFQMLASFGRCRQSTRLRGGPAGFAGHGSVRFQASRTSLFPPRVELVRDVAAGSEVHLVRRLALLSLTTSWTFLRGSPPVHGYPPALRPTVGGQSPPVELWVVRARLL